MYSQVLKLLSSYLAKFLFVTSCLIAQVRLRTPISNAEFEGSQI